MDFVNKENLSKETILNKTVCSNDEINELLDLVKEKTNLLHVGNFSKNDITLLFKYILNGDVESLKILIKAIQATNL